MDENSTPADMARETADALPEEFQDAFARVVQAGMKVMFSDETHELMLDALEGEGDMAEKMGTTMADLMGMLFKQSNASMPTEVIAPAGTYLLAKGTEFLEQVTGQEIPGEDIAMASEVMIRKIMTEMGIADDALDKAGSVAMQAAEDAPEEEMAEEPEGEL